MGILHKNRKPAVEKKQAGGTIPFYTNFQVQSARNQAYDPSNLLKKYSAPAATKSDSSDDSDLKMPELDAKGLESELLADVNKYNGLKAQLRSVVNSGVSTDSAVYKAIIDDMQEHVTLSNSRRQNTLDNYNKAHENIQGKNNAAIGAFVHNQNGQVLVERRNVNGEVEFGYVAPSQVNKNLTKDGQRIYNPITTNEALSLKRRSQHPFWLSDKSGKGSDVIMSIQSMMGFNKAFETIDQAYKNMGSSTEDKKYKEWIETAQGKSGDIAAFAEGKYNKDNKDQLQAAFNNVLTRLKGNAPAWNAIKTNLELTTGSTEGDGGEFDEALKLLLLNDKDKRSVHIHKYSSSNKNKNKFGDPNKPGKKPGPGALTGVGELTPWTAERLENKEELGETIDYKLNDLKGLSKFYKEGDSRRKDLTIQIRNTKEAGYTTEILGKDHDMTIAQAMKSPVKNSTNTMFSLDNAVMAASGTKLSTTVGPDGETLASLSAFSKGSSLKSRIGFRIVDAQGNGWNPPVEDDPENNIKGLKTFQDEIQAIKNDFEKDDAGKQFGDDHPLPASRREALQKQLKEKSEAFFDQFKNQGLTYKQGLYTPIFVAGERIAELATPENNMEDTSPEDWEKAEKKYPGVTGIVSELLPLDNETDMATTNVDRNTASGTKEEKEFKNGLASVIGDNAGWLSYTAKNDYNIGYAFLPYRSKVMTQLYDEGKVYMPKAESSLANLGQAINEGVTSDDLAASLNMVQLLFGSPQ